MHSFLIEYTWWKLKTTEIQKLMTILQQIISTKVTLTDYDWYNNFNLYL